MSSKPHSSIIRGRKCVLGMIWVTDMRIRPRIAPNIEERRTMLAEPNSQPWRRFIRFSLRGLIVFVLVIGIAIGWLVSERRNSA